MLCANLPYYSRHLSTLFSPALSPDTENVDTHQSCSEPWVSTFSCAFERSTGALRIEGTASRPDDGSAVPYLLEGRLLDGEITVVATFVLSKHASSGNYILTQDVARGGWWKNLALRWRLRKLSRRLKGKAQRSQWDWSLPVGPIPHSGQPGRRSKPCCMKWRSKPKTSRMRNFSIMEKERKSMRS